MDFDDSPGNTNGKTYKGHGKPRRSPTPKRQREISTALSGLTRHNTILRRYNGGGLWIPDVLKTKRMMRLDVDRTELESRVARSHKKRQYIVGDYIYAVPKRDSYHAEWEKEEWHDNQLDYHCGNPEESYYASPNNRALAHSKIRANRSSGQRIIGYSIEENVEEDKEEDEKEEEDTLQTARSQPYGRRPNRCRSRSPRLTSSLLRTNGEKKDEEDVKVVEMGKTNHDEEEVDVKVILIEDDQRDDEMRTKAAVQFITD